jgi:ATP-dependent DNA helicase RecQ
MLAASFRTGQRFGGQHLIDVLMGSFTDKILQCRHEQVKTFGAGKDKTPNQWRHILRQLVAMGLLDAPVDLHGGLVITQEGQDVLRGNTEVALVEPRVIVKSSREKTKQVTLALTAELDDDDTKLRQALKAWRAKTAKTQGLPPYVVFNDQTLAHLVNDKPKDKSALGRVHGMGANRTTRYAEDILEIMQEFGNTKEKTLRR